MFIEFVVKICEIVLLNVKAIFLIIVFGEMNWDTYIYKQ